MAAMRKEDKLEMVVMRKEDKLEMAAIRKEDQLEIEKKMLAMEKRSYWRDESYNYVRDGRHGK